MENIRTALLADFKKANQKRKEAMAIKYGYPSAEAMLSDLKGENITGTPTPTSTSKQEKKPTIHNVHILDVSSSMNSGGRLRTALLGINQEISFLKTEKTANYTNTFVTFSNSGTTKRHHTKIPIADVEEVRASASGMTALYEAIGTTLSSLLKTANGTDKYLIKVFSDGCENHSQGEYDNSERGRQTLKELISLCESRGFTITFVGTEGDIFSIVQNLNINMSNTMSHNNTADSIQASFTATRGATMSYAADVAKGKDVKKGFYKKVGKL